MLWAKVLGKYIVEFLWESTSILILEGKNCCCNFWEGVLGGRGVSTGVFSVCWLGNCFSPGIKCKTNIVDDHNKIL